MDEIKREMVQELNADDVKSLENCRCEDIHFLVRHICDQSDDDIIKDSKANILDEFEENKVDGHKVIQDELEIKMESISNEKLTKLHDEIRDYDYSKLMTLKFNQYKRDLKENGIKHIKHLREEIDNNILTIIDDDDVLKRIRERLEEETVFEGGWSKYKLWYALLPIACVILGVMIKYYK